MTESIVPLKISNVDKLAEQWIAEGERRAEERIIKLLEADAGKCIQTKPMNEHLDDYCNCRLIALIKGEK